MYRRYITVLFGGVGLIAGVLLAVAVWLEPNAGDLTRLGGFAENQFGWVGEQVQYTPPLAQPYDSSQAYDVLVIGDSFSLQTVASVRTNPGGFWTDHLAAISGATVGVGWEAKFPVARYLESASFRDHPPRFLVIELAERNLAVIPPAASPDCSLPAARAVTPMESRAVPGSLRAIQRPAHHPTLRAAIDEANDVIAKSVQRLAGLGELAKVGRVILNRSDLFSNALPHEILLFADDFLKVKWAETDLRRTACTMRSWQMAAEANGFTQLLILIAPDKTTIYQPYMRDPIIMPAFIPALAERVGTAVLRADLALGAAVAQGRKDVYLPNDTHWGSAGARIAAELVAGRIFVPIPLQSGHPPQAAKPPRL